MFFSISKLLEGFTNPATLLALVILANGVATLFRRRRVALALHCTTVVLVVFLSFSPITNWLAASLESRFPTAPVLPDKVDGVIVLGGTERVEQSAFWHQPTFSDPAPIATMLMLSRRYPSAKLVFSGGGHAFGDPAIGETSIVRDFVTEIGGDADRILYEDQSRNTYENAVFSALKIHPKQGEIWVLVCQAIGMPRAVGVFRKQGWQVIPFPAGYLTVGNIHRMLPLSLLGSLGLAGITTHEWLGLVVYRLMGYTDAFFPR